MAIQKLDKAFVKFNCNMTVQERPLHIALKKSLTCVYIGNKYLEFKTMSIK